MSVVRKAISQWTKVGLDLSDSTFSKLYEKESKFEEDEKYDLSPEKFRAWSKAIIEKVVRINAIEEFKVTINSTTKRDVLKEYSTIERAKMEAERKIRWPAADPKHTKQEDADAYTDSLIKSSVVGKWIHASLTKEAKEQLEPEIDFFKVESDDGDKSTHFDGPSYFYIIARHVDPDNGHLVAKAKKQLRELDVKNYNYDVKKMLADFHNLSTRVLELGGTVSDDEQRLNLWTACGTMREKEFSRFVNDLEDDEAAKDSANRTPINQLINKINAKQTRMISKGQWNTMSQEDVMIMSLVGLLDKSKARKRKVTNNDTKDSSGNANTSKAEDKERKTDREYRVPDWKKIAPAEGEPKSKEVNGRTYHWCTKCRDNEGLWALHEKHDDSFKASRKQKAAKKADDGDSTKKVSFNVSTEDSVEEAAGEEGVQIKVKDELLKNAKTYLSQFADFREGGV